LRPYKPPFNHEQTLAIITKGDGRLEPSYFDPRVLEAFGDLHAEFQGVWDAYKDSVAGKI
jgi:putative two-component system response regulator